MNLKKSNIMLTAWFILLNIVGVSLIKLGGEGDTLFIFNGGIIKLSFSIITLIGVFCYAVSFLLWINIIRIHDLSYISPLATGIVTVLTFFVGILVFNEIVTTWKIVGLVSIVLGVACMNLKK